MHAPGTVDIGIHVCECAIADFTFLILYIFQFTINVYQFSNKISLLK